MPNLFNLPNVDRQKDIEIILNPLLRIDKKVLKYY